MNNGAIKVFSLFPQTPVTPENETEKKPQQLLAASCSGGARARARVREELAEYYCDCFGRRNCAPSIRRQIDEALEAGMEPQTIAMAMDCATEAEYPSWAYAAAVIRNCIAEGALTPEAYRARSAKHRAGRKTGGRKPSWERSYQEGELDYLFDASKKYDD